MSEVSNGEKAIQKAKNPMNERDINLCERTKAGAIPVVFDVCSR